MNIYREDGEVLEEITVKSSEMVDGEEKKG